MLPGAGGLPGSRDVLLLQSYAPFSMPSSFASLCTHVQASRVHASAVLPGAGGLPGSRDVLLSQLYASFRASSRLVTQGRAEPAGPPMRGMPGMSGCVGCMHKERVIVQ